MGLFYEKIAYAAGNDGSWTAGNPGKCKNPGTAC